VLYLELGFTTRAARATVVVEGLGSCRGRPCLRCAWAGTVISSCNLGWQHSRAAQGLPPEGGEGLARLVGQRTKIE
jgi:hypothetical protein